MLGRVLTVVINGVSVQTFKQDDQVKARCCIVTSAGMVDTKKQTGGHHHGIGQQNSD